jgi:cysteine desulfurase/selenocysteine lyase
MTRAREHERTLTAYAIEQLSALDGIQIHGPLTADARGGLVSFSVDGIHPHDLAELLGREGVCVRASHHCAQPLMAKLGVPATTRASFAAYNVPEDVDALITAVRSAQRIFA